MDVLIVSLRITHILAGVLWVGGAALLFFYVAPTINRLGPDAEKFVNEVVLRRKLPHYFLLVSTLAVAAGVLLYALNWARVATTPAGLTFGIGGLVAIVTWVGGNLMIPRTLHQLTGIGAEIKAAGGQPSDAQMGRMQAAQDRLRRLGLADLTMLSFAVVAMAVARYMR